MIEYRKADIIDAETLARVRMDFLCEANGVTGDAEKQQLFKNNYAYFTDALADESFLAWLALDDGRVAATSGVSLYRHPPNKDCPSGSIAYISNMFTYPQYRGQGLATKLFELIVAEAEDRGCGKIWLNATESGRPIYEKFGFTHVSGDMVYHANADGGCRRAAK